MLIHTHTHTHTYTYTHTHKETHTQTHTQYRKLHHEKNNDTTKLRNLKTTHSQRPNQSESTPGTRINPRTKFLIFNVLNFGRSTR